MPYRKANSRQIASVPLLILLAWIGAVDSSEAAVEVIEVRLTFFGPDNWELLVKVLNACGVNEKFWVLTAAATTVEYEITITDTVTGETWTYDNPLGFPSPAVTDIEAFDCSP